MPYKPMPIPGTSDFSRRVPFYWKHGSGLRKLYESDGAIISLSMFCLSSPLYGVPAIIAAITESIFWIGLAFPMFFVAIPFLIFTLYMLTLEPVGYDKWDRLRAEKFRALPDEEIEKLKPLAKKMLKDEAAYRELLDDWQYIMDNQKVVHEQRSVSPKIAAMVAVYKEEIKQAKDNEKIQQELEASTRKYVEEQARKSNV